MALVGGVWRDAQLDPHVGMALAEANELPAHDLGFRAERAPGEGESCRPARAAAGSRTGRHPGRDDEKARQKEAVHPHPNHDAQPSSFPVMFARGTARPPPEYS